jgi:hypothetical protein
MEIPMKLPLATVLIAGLAAGGLAFAQDKDKPKAEKKKAAAKAVTVRLAEQNKSGESGSARLTPMGDKTKVEITLKGAPKGTPQPAHIHDGSCPNPDPKPRYPLENVVDGKSTTEVAASLDTLLKGKSAINVHKSKEEIKVYVACGNIARGGGAKKAEGTKKMDK